MITTNTRTTTSPATPPNRITKNSPVGSVPCVRTTEIQQHRNTTHMLNIIAEIQGNIASAFGLLGAAIGVGLIGQKAAEAVGRNPAASGKVLVQAIIGMALAEGLGILALFLAK